MQTMVVTLRFGLLRDWNGYVRSLQFALFGTAIGGIVKYVVCISLMLFAYATVVDTKPELDALKQKCWTERSGRCTWCVKTEQYQLRRQWRQLEHVLPGNWCILDQHIVELVFDFACGFGV